MPPATVPASPGWDGHLLLLHRSEDERRSMLARWVLRGLQRGETVIYGEPDVESRPPSVVSVLRDQGVAAEEAIATGRLVVLPPTEFYPVNGQAALVERMLSDGVPAVRMSAEARSALTVLPAQAYVQAEAGIDRLCRSHPVAALCQFNRAVARGDWLEEVVSRHVTGIRERQLRTAPSDAGLALFGSVDDTNHDVLEATVRAATSGAAAPFRFDLAGVAFLSASGCRALVEGTRGFRARGGQVRLAAASPAVERILRLLDLDELMLLEPAAGDS